MSLGLHQLTVPVFKRGLENLATFLKKGEDWANEKGIPHSDLLEARLAPDMANLIFQIQRCSDTAKNACVRINPDKVEAVKMEDNEKTFGDLQERIRKTITFLDGVKPEALDGREDAEVILPFGDNPKFKGSTYVGFYAIPNFFFHETTAYAILRNKGVPVGKMDFLGKPPSQT